MRTSSVLDAKELGIEMTRVAPVVVSFDRTAQSMLSVHNGTGDPITVMTYGNVTAVVVDPDTGGAVTPEALLRWHRELSGRKRQCWRSTRGLVGRPCPMSSSSSSSGSPRENRRWGCVRIQGELRGLENSPDQTPASHAECLQRDRGICALHLHRRTTSGNKWCRIDVPGTLAHAPVCDQPASVARLVQHSRAKRGPRPSRAKTMAHQARSAKKVWQMWCKCGARCPWTRHEEPISAPRTSLTWTFFGADDGIRTRDPHLGKVLESVHPVLLLPGRGLLSLRPGLPLTGL